MGDPEAGAAADAAAAAAPPDGDPMDDSWADGLQRSTAQAAAARRRAVGAGDVVVLRRCGLFEGTVVRVDAVDGDTASVRILKADAEEAGLLTGVRLDFMELVAGGGGAV